MATNANDQYQRVTDAIIALVEGGNLLPWQQPWKVGQFARSLSTGKAYNGINRWYLTSLAQASNWIPWFGTYKKIAEMGGQVHKGEKSNICVLWNFRKVADANGKESTIPMLKIYNVFSASQADWPNGLPAKCVDASSEAVGTDSDDYSEAMEALGSYWQREAISVTFGGDSACYSPRTDSVKLPDIGSFVGTDHFYATAFHEAAHSTGHAKRLNRPGIVDFDHFGSHQYSREELVAELGSALIMGTLGLDKPNMVENQASYIASWIRALKDDSKAIVWAAGRAEKAANRILNIAPVEVEE